MQDDRLLKSVPGVSGKVYESILSSRYEVLEEIKRSWISGQIEQATLTGEPGSGKSWLWRAAIESVRTEVENIRWFWIHQLPGSHAIGILQSLLMAIDGKISGYSSSTEVMMARVEKRISEIIKDGFRVEIVVEEAHLLSKNGFEIIRILQEKLREQAVQIGILYVGQVNLVYRHHQFSGRSHVPRWHLKHLTLNEAIELLRVTRSDLSWTRAEADWIHREALGNPRRIIRWAETWVPDEHKPAKSDKPIVKPGIGNFKTQYQTETKDNHLWNEPLIPARPPIEESEGCIEVGYSDDEQAGTNLTAEGLSFDGSVTPVVALNENDDASRYGVTTSLIHEEQVQNLSATKIRIESPSKFAPYGLGNMRKATSHDQETDL